MTAVEWDFVILLLPLPIFSHLCVSGENVTGEK